MALLWGKVKFFFKSMLTAGLSGSTLTASTTETTGFFDVDHLIDWLEAFSWKAADDVDPVTITFDAGAGNAPTADYLAIRRHNLGTLGASVALQNSSDNFASDIETVAVALPDDDLKILKEARIIANGDFEVWQESIADDAIPPTGWVLAGASATVARESTIVQVGTYSCKLTRNGTNAFIGFETPNFLFFANKTVTFGCWVNASVADRARLVISDKSGSFGLSPFHTGGGTGEWLEATLTFDAVPTRFQVDGSVINGDTTAYFDGAVVKVASTVAPTDVSDFIQPLSNGKRYWRLKIADDDSASFTVPPSMAIAVWGDKVELDHVSTSFDPNAEVPDVNINRGFGGIVTGIHEKSIDRAFTFGFMNKDTAFYDKVDDWWQTHGRKQFFVGWNTDDFPDDVYLMFPDGEFRNPRSMSGDNDRRFVTIDLRGVKE